MLKPRIGKSQHGWEVDWLPHGFTMEPRVRVFDTHVEALEHAFNIINRYRRMAGASGGIREQGYHYNRSEMHITAKGLYHVIA